MASRRKYTFGDFAADTAEEHGGGPTKESKALFDSWQGYNPSTLGIPGTEPMPLAPSATQNPVFDERMLSNQIMSMFVQGGGRVNFGQLPLAVAQSWRQPPPLPTPAPSLDLPTSGVSDAPLASSFPGGTDAGGAVPNNELSGILRQAGFKGQGLRTAYAVAMAESGGRPTAHNPDASTGDNSYGLFQINMLGNMGPDRRKQYGLKSNEDLFDPLTNAKVAYRMSGGGTNWGPWTTYTSGKYRQYLDQAQPSTGGGGGGGGGGGAGIRELFYDPLGAYDEGNWISPIGGHSDHVHVSFGTPQAALRGIKLAQQMGLRATENPYAEHAPVERVHTTGSYHYQTFPGKYGGWQLGKGLDVSGDADKMAAYFRAIKSML